MGNTSKTEPLAKRDIYYYRRRFINRVFGSLAKFFAQEAEKHGATKSKIAKRLDVDPAQITRWLAHPSNLTLESISDILLALDAEAEPLDIVPFRNRRLPNYAHPVLDTVLGKLVRVARTFRLALYHSCNMGLRLKHRYDCD